MGRILLDCNSFERSHVMKLPLGILVNDINKHTIMQKKVVLIEIRFKETF